MGAAAGGNFSDQMIRDVTRSTFEVDKEIFNFAAEAAAAKLTMEDHATEVEALERDFMERIIRALLRCLRDDAPAVLIRGVSSCMSQSGLASVERACQSPQVIVGGGDQRVHFELSALESLSAWDLRLSVRKFGFKTCIIIPTVDGELCDVDPMPVICSDSSSLVKGCTVRFTLSLFGSELLVDVLQLQNELKVVDDEGLQGASRKSKLMKHISVMSLFAGT